MSKRAILILIVFLAFLGVGGYFALRGGNVAIPPIETSLVRVTSPLPNAFVSSPFTIIGEARGNWFFEASFPLRILDEDGRELGEGFAEAEGDWMTTEFVPFRGMLIFMAPVTPTGTLILEKSNPSGLPEHYDEVRVPVRFAGTTTQTRNINLYFYNENNDKDAGGNIRCSAQGLIAVARTIPLTNTPIQDSVRELLKGPTSSERAQAPGTEFPLSGVTLTGANLSNGVLTLSFNDPQNATIGGSCRVGILSAMIEATAKQFGGVTTVRYQPEEVFQP